MKPVVAAVLGAVAFVVVLLVATGLVAVTHLPTIGNVLGLFGVVLGSWLAARLADGAPEQRATAGVLTPVVAVVLAVGMAARSGAVTAGVVPYTVVVLMAAACGVVIALQTS